MAGIVANLSTFVLTTFFTNSLVPAAQLGLETPWISMQQTQQNVDDLARIFNTALVSTRVEGIRDFSAELYSLVESPAFRALLGAVRQLARTQMIGDKEAAELLINTLRKADRIWGEYLFQEGLDRLKGTGAPVKN